ncbi:MAG TPA: ABC transporter permease [Kofleriaceae bacterium]|nr:ABC transporter permease [Kofleriaceae bacterium]
MLSDLRHAVRSLVRQPWLAVVAILTLGLAIGANTAIFTVVNAILLRPLPYADPERLVRIHTAFRTNQNHRYWLSSPEYFDLLRDARSYQSVAAWSLGTATFGDIDRPVRVAAAYTTAGLADTLGVAPAQGRYFTPEEARRGQDRRVVVLGHELWQRAFGGDPDIVGRAVTLDGLAFSVIGVMPPGFDFPDAEVEAWAPLPLDGRDPAEGRASHFLHVVARLARGVSHEQASAELAGLSASWGRLDSPEWHATTPDEHPMTVHALQDEIVGAAKAPLWLIQAAVLFVLLIACANISNLLLARAESRSREIAVRVALGAGRTRLVRMFLIESALLAAAGAAVGITIAVWGVDLAAGFMPAGAPRLREISVDGRVLGFALACAAAATAIFGLTPLWHARGVDLHDGLKDGGRGSSRQSRLRRALVTVEVALAIVLVIGCSLALRSFARLQQVDVGFRPEGLLTFELELPEVRYPDSPAVLAFWERLTRELEGIPGVERVSQASGLPPAQPLTTNLVWFEGAPPHTSKGAPVVDFWTFVSEDHFEALGLRMVAGRALRRDDRAAVVVNQSLAREFFPGADPIGQPIQLAPWRGADVPLQTIVGVVADVKQQGMAQPSGTEAYIPVGFAPSLIERAPLTMSVVVRAASPDALAGPIEAAVRGLDASIPLSNVRTMDRLLWDAVARPRFLTLVVSVFGALALLLAVIGVHGVMSISVARRTRELGIRMALGARPAGVRSMVLRQGMVLVGGGVAVGLVAALALNTALSRVLAGVLYDTPVLDPVTFTAVGALVGGVAALACWLPARRATRVDPMVAMRAE